MAKTPLTTLVNIGPYTELKLIEAGIDSVETLSEVGAIAAFCMLEQRAKRLPSENTLWALAGALANRHWKTLTIVEKIELRRQHTQQKLIIEQRSVANHF